MTVAAEPTGRDLGPSRRRRIMKIVLWLGGLALFWFVLQLLGVDVRGGSATCGTRSRKSRVGYLIAALDQRRPAQTFLAGLVVLRHPQGRVPARRRAVARRRRLRSRRGDEQLPPREHRHVRDPADVRRRHPGLHVRRLARGLPRAEDLLHARRDLRLPVHVPERPGLVRPQLRERDVAPRADDSDRRRRASSRSSSSPGSSGGR